MGVYSGLSLRVIAIQFGLATSSNIYVEVVWQESLMLMTEWLEQAS